MAVPLSWGHNGRCGGCAGHPCLAGWEWAELTGPRCCIGLTALPWCRHPSAHEYYDPCDYHQDADREELELEVRCPCLVSGPRDGQ